MRNLLIAFVCLVISISSEAKLYSKLFIQNTKIKGYNLPVYGGQIGYRYKKHIVFTEIHAGHKVYNLPAGIYNGKQYSNPSVTLESVALLNIGYAYRIKVNKELSIQPYIRAIGDYVYYSESYSKYNSFAELPLFSMGCAANYKIYKRIHASIHYTYTPQKFKTTETTIQRGSTNSIGFGISL